MTDKIERAADFLQHYGVKGMKWGVTRDDSGAERKMTGKEKKAAIIEARTNINAQTNAAENKYLEKTAKINSDYARNKLRDPEVAKQVRDKGYRKAMEVLDKDYGNIMNDPDVAIANKMTTGEKWATGVTVGLTGLAFAGYAASIAGSVKK